MMKNKPDLKYNPDESEDWNKGHHEGFLLGLNAGREEGARAVDQAIQLMLHLSQKREKLIKGEDQE